MTDDGPRPDAPERQALDAAERDELERLRRLIGPSEMAHETLLADVAAASEMARRAEHEAGRLRAHVEQLSTDLWRARQDQDLVLTRREMSLPAYVRYRIARRWRISGAPRVARLIDRVRPGRSAAG
ncbi:MAG: hypothetical protein AAGG08_11110 [Actinomycetota bacterium]